MKTLNYDINELFLIGSKLLNSKIESEIIIRDSLNITKEEFYLSLRNKIDYSDYENIIKKFNLRKNGYPLSYITNKKYFLDYEFIVNEGVFIPRFETEEVVYNVIKKFNKFKNSLDICCGTGVIGISLILNNLTDKCTFVDISDKAIYNTFLNLKKFNIDKNRYEIIKSDMFKNLKSKYDLIISNPPYIKILEYDNLPKDVKIEPKEALISGFDGLNHIKILINESKNFLNKGGILIFEFEKEQLKHFKDKLINFKIIQIIKTYSDNILGIMLEKL
ncbi:MAG TPA: peptide chain release factor N(5)-glutamine methyltransferase [Caldisericia bacterium]|nr:peptide chain release factor N(5)-glutamine methyltransferase [Caldisericia bacterium]